MLERYHLGTKYFQIFPRHLSSSPSTCPLLFLSHPGSLRPKIEKSWLAEAVSMDFRVLLESSSVLRSFLMASAVCLLASLSRLARLSGRAGTGFA